MKHLAFLFVAALASTPAYAQDAGGARVEFTAGYDSTSGKITYADAVGPLMASASKRAPSDVSAAS